MTSPDNSLLQKLADYTETLAFVQDELKDDREKLAQAREQNKSTDIIALLESDIEKLEKGIDRYQEWINLLQNKLKNDD